MVKIEFIYMKNKYIMENDDINSIFQNYSSLINKNLKELLFYYKGKYLNIENKLYILNLKIIIIFVFNKNKNNINHNEKIKDIICPECQVLGSFFINENFYIKEICKNNHKYKLSLNNFIDLNKIDKSEINCSKCSDNKLYYNDLIYINRKGEYICPLCLNSDEIDIIDNKYKYYNYIEHNKKYESYCNDCKLNLCSKCEINHKIHNIISFKKIKPNKKKNRRNKK